MNAVATSSAPIRVLLVEDDPGIAEMIRNGVDPERFLVRHASSVADGRRLLDSSEHDAIVLDLSLPDGHGFEIADALREAGSSVPIVMLTAKGEVHERIDGFRHGADDYVAKPFAVEELTARLEAVVRRSRPRDRHRLKYADVELDLLRRTVRRRGVESALSAREMDLLVYLMSHPEEVLERDRILEDVWGDEAEDDSNVVNVYVNYLRNKLEGHLHPRLIHTVRGRGYVLSKNDPEKTS